MSLRSASWHQSVFRHSTNILNLAFGDHQIEFFFITVSIDVLVLLYYFKNMLLILSLNLKQMKMSSDFCLLSQIPRTPYPTLRDYLQVFPAVGGLTLPPDTDWANGELGLQHWRYSASQSLPFPSLGFLETHCGESWLCVQQLSLQYPAGCSRSPSL